VFEASAGDVMIVVLLLVFLLLTVFDLVRDLRS
jgi:hypothetical protein